LVVEINPIFLGATVSKIERQWSLKDFICLSVSVSEDGNVTVLL